MAVDGEIKVSFEYDRDKVWNKIRGRKAVYMDMNIWIDMADGKNQEAQAIKDRLRECVRAGSVFCPLLPSLLWELYRQKHSKLQTGQLMEELSLNVSFVRPKEVFTWEVTSFAKRLSARLDEKCERKSIYTPVVGYVASWGGLHYPAGSDPEYVENSSRLIIDRLNSLGLAELLKMRDDGRISGQFANMVATPYQAKAIDLQKLAKGNRDKVRKIEELSVIESYIFPVIKELDDRLIPEFHRFITSVSDGVYGQVQKLLAELPAIHNHIEAMYRNSEDPNRKDRVSDFFDLDMLAVPLAYADVFVTQDKWIRERFLKPGDFLKRSECKFCSTYPEFAAWLDALN